MSKPKISFQVFDPDTDEPMELPSHFEVCGRCRGTGVHDHPAFSNGLRPEETEDPDFMEDYRHGAYDVPCSECGGLRVVAVPDEDRLNDAQKAALAAHREGLAEAAAERRMRERGIEF